ncbi:uncharacterized protein LOC135119106 [Helicoverpa armigera]|uniref:uncharacterized protein LOC135119106 n=1 Tax=Helicoverpa armigera TaxID=29058 RepID=UPI003082DD3B
MVLLIFDQMTSFTTSRLTWFSQFHLILPLTGKDEKEVLSSNKRTKHEYSRSTNFDNIVKQYDSPKQVPKCKTNLTARLGHTHEAGNESSRSSLYSIPSIEWDGRCKSDFGLRSRSLPRNRTARLFRTQSHSGFINSYMKDPEPTHYHVPRCRSCGASNVSYAFELSKEEKGKKAKNHPSIYYSVDNIPQKCSEEVARDPTYVKVQEKFVPVFKVEKKDVEFVESQEFNEDNYIGDIGNSFSSENQTVIEKSDANDQTVQICEKNAQISTKSTIKDDKETLTRDLEEDDGIEDVNKTLESMEGEYHSFTDLEDSYESPVKELVEKDIRDYSVPIDFYCEDFKAKEEVKKSPLKVKNTLEPILEESKSSYGDDSNTSQNDKKEEVVENIVGDVVNIAVLASQLKQEISTIAAQKVTPEALVAECVSRQESYLVNEEGSDITANDVESFTTNVVQTAVDIYENEASEQDMLDSVYDNVFEILSNENESEVNEVKRQNSLASTLSSTERISMDSTAEFEKYEVVSEILSGILSRIEFVEIVLKVKTPKVELLEHFNTDDDIQETFSIAKMIADIEQSACLNETVLTEVSDTDIGQTNKIIEGIIYYIFDRAMFINNQKLKSNKKTVKKVITVADFEDILFTAKPIWMDSEDYEEIPLEEKQSVEKDFYAIKDFFNAKCLQSATEQKIKKIKEKRCDCEKAAKVDDDVVVNSHEKSCQCDDHVDDNSEHNEQVHDKPQENGDVLDDENQVYFDPIVNNIEVIEEKTDYCKQVAIYHEYKQNLTYILDKPTFSDLDTTNFNLEPQVDNNITTNDASKTADIELNETFVETSDMNNAFHEDFSQSEDATISSQTEECFVTPDVDLTSELKENISLETDTYVIETVIDTSQEEYHSTVNDEFKDISDRTEEFASFSVQSSANNIEEYLSPIRDPSLEDTIFSPEYRDISLITNNVKEDTKKKESSRKRKHVKEAQSRSSSPNRKTTKQFELNESPIKSESKATPLKNLAKRRAYSDIASPFMKKTHVLAMSQTEHSGGVKYWLSFDENLPVVETEKVARNVKSIDDTLPSFISIDIDEDSMEGNPKKFFDKATSMNTKRSSVLLHEYNENDISFPSPSTSNIEFARERVREIVADPELERDDTDKDLPQKKLLYELHSRPSKRLYSSWPPFEDTLFYRIISKFRMSESFDPNDLEDPNFDSSA